MSGARLTLVPPRLETRTEYSSLSSPAQPLIDREQMRPSLDISIRCEGTSSLSPLYHVTSYGEEQSTSISKVASRPSAAVIGFSERFRTGAETSFEESRKKKNHKHLFHFVFNKL